MLYLSFGVATAALVVVEVLRLFRVPPLGRLLHHFMAPYTDDRDDGPLILTHIYLLLGCAIPLWLCGAGSPDGHAASAGFQRGFNRYGLSSYAGIVSLGIGDAAVCGMLAGVLVLRVGFCLWVWAACGWRFTA